MSSGLRKILSIEKEEVSAVSILLFQSVFLGIFAGTFDVSAQSYFLEVFSADQIPKAFAYSGAVGILITSLYSFLQARMRFSVFAVLNLLFVAVVSISLRLGFVLYNSDHLVFAMFVLMGPLTIISFLSFWGTVGRIFSLRQGKRLFGLIDAGQIMGIILASYAIPILLSFEFKILNSLYICSLAAVIALVIQIFISTKYDLTRQTIIHKGKKRSNFFDLFKTKYTSLMVGFVVLSVLAAFFIHYNFLVVTEENYPEPNALASFLGVFMGTVMVFTLTVKTFVYSRLMKTYGLKLALAISPIILAIFVVAALLVGSIYGYSAASSGFTLFFLLLVSAKLFSKSFKDSVEVPSSKILYQSLDPDVRYDVQSRIDGTVNELAALSAGLLMAGLALIAGFKLIHFSVVLGGILLLWLFFAFRLHGFYKKSLNDALKDYQASKGNKSRVIAIHEIEDISMLKNQGIEKILRFAPQSWNGFISKNIKSLLSGPENLRTITLKWIDKLTIQESESILQQTDPKSGGKDSGLILSLLKRFGISGIKSDRESLRLLLESEDPEDMLRAVLIIENNPLSETNFQHISLLLRETNFKVKVSTIRLIGKQKYTQFSGRLIDLLEDRVFYPFAFNALTMMAEDIIDKLDQAFYRTSVSPKMMDRLLRLLCSVNSAKVIPLLISKLDQPEIYIHKRVLKNLGERGYIPNSIELQRLTDYIHKIIGVTAWDITAKHSLVEGKFSAELIRAFEQEIKDDYSFLFDILTVMYDSQTVYQIKNNIETGSSESIGYSLELLDIFVDESIKYSLFALLEDSGENSRISALQTEYPVEILKGEKLLHGIINRDYNYLDSYTRILSIHELSQLPDYLPGEDIIAQLFNPDLRVSEISAAQLFSLNRDAFREVLERLPADRAVHLHQILDDEFKDREGIGHRLLNKVLENTGLFDGFSVFSLFQLSSKFSSYPISPGNDLIFKRNERRVILYIEDQSIDIFTEDGRKILSVDHGFFIDLESRIPEEVENIIFISHSELTLLVLKDEDLEELIFDHEEIYLPIINRMFKQEAVNVPDDIK